MNMYTRESAVSLLARQMHICIPTFLLSVMLLYNENIMTYEYLTCILLHTYNDISNIHNIRHNFHCLHNMHNTNEHVVIMEYSIIFTCIPVLTYTTYDVHAYVSYVLYRVLCYVTYVL